jgi:glycosyltransferase involved in cell wall biosynthesis
LRRIVEDAQAGKVFRANDAQHLAKKLIEMFKNPSELKRMGQKGHDAALGKYSWRHDAKRLLQAYDDILLRIEKEG